MAKYNSKVKTKTKTTNLAGGEAYKETPELELISILLTSFVQDSYYRGENDTAERLKNLIIGFKDKKFPAKASIYARNKFGMRSISHIVAGEIAKLVKGENWTKDYFNKVVYRVDDITEIFSYYRKEYGKPVPNSLKKGLGIALGKFDKYQIAKYRGENKEFSLVDVVNYIHPKPTDKNKEALKLLIEDNLRSENTWEAKKTEAGKSENKEEASKQAWIELIKERKIGYFALLKNLRNIIEEAPEIIDIAIELLKDEKLIKKSLVLPFRYSTAYEQISITSDSNASRVLEGISEAVDISLDNIPKFDGNTLVVCDYSGSMGNGITSRRGKGTLFGIALAKTNNADFMIFGSDATYVTFNRKDSTLSLVDWTNKLNGYGYRNYGKYNVGHGTNFNAIFAEANKAYDRIIIFSDMQGWEGYHVPTIAYNDYCRKYNCEPKIYSIDLAGYGTLQFPEKDIFCLAGFSEKIFDTMKLLESDRQALINEINQIEL